MARLRRGSVSFVSVTQAFNATTSMGRLTLNVLLFFAQFEREGTPADPGQDRRFPGQGDVDGCMLPLGYDAAERTLKINQPEAAAVRQIFQR